MSNNKEIVLSIDTGFDGGKICVNGHLFNIPFMIQDISASTDEFKLRRNDSDFIRCIYQGKTYLLGAVAKTFILDRNRREERQSKMESFYTMDRYGLELFEIALDAFIAYGLYQYAEITKDEAGDERFTLEDINNWKINVGVALPHKYMDELTPVVHGYLSKPQNIELLIGDIDTGVLSYKIDEIFFNSQVICALINEAVDDNGEEFEGDSPYDHLPALILDGGYKTLGKLLFARDESITGDDSDMNYAMMNINDRVAATLTEKTGNIYTGYMVESLAMNNEPVNYIDKTDKMAKSIDVKELKDKVEKEIVSDLIDNLNQEYNNLLDIKMILLAGGTGNIYYPYIKQYCEKERPFLKDHVILAGTHGFMGKECPPVYAVVCGLYKDMLMQLKSSPQ